MFRKQLKITNWKLKMSIVALIFCFWSNDASAATIGKPNNYLLQSGLVGWWTFDGVDMTPNVVDRSGQGNHGRISGQTSTTTVPGEIGQALFFDGSDDVVVVSPSSSINDLPAITVSFWARPSTVGTQRPYVTKADNSAGGHGWSIGHHTGTASSLYFLVTGFTTTDLTVATPAGAFVANEWAHYIATWDGTNQSSGVHLYKNGVELSYQTVSNGGSASPQSDSAVSLKIGRESGYSSNYVHGSVDDVRLYNRVLSSSEIIALYRASVSKVSATPARVASDGLIDGLVGWWTFDGADMTPNVRDRSTSANHGRISGQTATTTVPGKLGQAVFFDGVDDAVRIPDANSLDITDALTLSAWVQPAGVSASSEAIIVKGNVAGGSAASQSYRLDFSADRTPRFSLTSGSNVLSVTAATRFLRNNEWYHLVAVFDGVETVYLYSDGQLIGSNTFGGFGSINVDDTYGLGIGARGDGSTLTTSAINVDDVRIYNRALSTTEIAKLYAQGSAKQASSGVSIGSLSSGLVGHWTFDAPDMTPLVRDRNPSGNSGYVVNQGPTTTVPGKFGQALDFDGVDDYVTIATNSSINNIWDSGGSVSFWVRPRSAGEANAGFWVAKNWAILSASGAVTSLGTGIEFSVQWSGSTAVWRQSGPANSPIRFKNWNHVVVTYDSDSTANDPVFYINGVIDTNWTEITAPSGTREAETATLYLGNASAVASRTIDGILDDVRFYDRTLSASEVSRLYNTGR